MVILGRESKDKKRTYLWIAILLSVVLATIFVLWRVNQEETLSSEKSEAKTNIACGDYGCTSDSDCAGYTGVGGDYKCVNEKGAIEGKCVRISCLPGYSVSDDMCSCEKVVVNTCEGGGWSREPISFAENENFTMTGYAEDTDGIDLDSLEIKINGISMFSSKIIKKEESRTKLMWSQKLSGFKRGTYSVSVTWKDKKGNGGDNCSLASTFFVTGEEKFPSSQIFYINGEYCFSFWIVDGNSCKQDRTCYSSKDINLGISGVTTFETLVECQNFVDKEYWQVENNQCIPVDNIEEALDKMHTRGLVLFDDIIACQNTLVDNDGESNMVVLTIAASNASASLKENAQYVCDGINDATIIQNVINEYPSGAEIRFTQGVFVFNKGISIGNYFTLKGNGSSTIFKVVDNADFGHILGNDTFPEIRFSKIEGILFDGNKENVSSYIDGMFFRKGSWITIKDIYVQNFTGNGVVLSGNESGGFCDENTIESSVIQYCDLNGLLIDVASDNLITNCSFYGNGNGTDSYSGAVRISGGTSNGLMNCNIHTNNNNGIITNWCHGTRIIGSDVRRNKMNGLFSYYDQNLNVQGSTFEGNGTAGINYLASGILIYDGLYNTFIGNTSTNYGGVGSQLYGIYMNDSSGDLSGPDYMIIQNNILNGNSTASKVIIGDNNVVSDNIE